MKEKLGDIFDIGSGGTPSKKHPEYYGGDIPWVKTGDLKSEYLFEVEDCITEEGLNNSSAKMYDKDTVLIAMYGATIGATSILKFAACTNQACAAFKKNDRVLPEYLYYFLRSKKQKFINDGVGGAQPNISAGYLKKVEMEVCSLSKQTEIVAVLDKINNIINMRKKELDYLDELIKARFVELFDNAEYSVKSISKLSDLITKGTTPTTAGYSFLDEGVNFFKIESIKDDHSINLEKVAHIGEDCHKAFKRSQLKAGDILFSIVGAIGRTAIIEERDLPGNTNQALAIIRLKNGCEMSQRFLISALESPMVVEQYNKKKRGIAQINLSLQDIGNLRVIVPPLEEQNQFTDFVKQVDKSKFAIQKALDETQTLFDSLMQEYFG